MKLSKFDKQILELANMRKRVTLQNLEKYSKPINPPISKAERERLMAEYLKRKAA